MAESQLAEGETPRSSAQAEPDSRSDPEATLMWLNDRLAEIYSIDKLNRPIDQVFDLDVKSYLNIYVAIHSYCTISYDSRGKKADPKQRGSHLSGEEVYRVLKSAIIECCSNIRKAIFDQNDTLAGQDESGDEIMLSTYFRLWTSYAHLCRRMQHLFRFLERHWVKRELDEGSKCVYEIGTLHKQVWRKEVLVLRGAPRPQESSRVVLAVTRLQLNKVESPSDDSNDNSLVQNVLASWSELDLRLVDGRLEMVPPEIEETEGTTKPREYKAFDRPGPAVHTVALGEAAVEGSDT